MSSYVYQFDPKKDNLELGIKCHLQRLSKLKNNNINFKTLTTGVEIVENENMIYISGRIRSRATSNYNIDDKYVLFCLDLILSYLERPIEEKVKSSIHLDDKVFDIIIHKKEGV